MVELPQIQAGELFDLLQAVDQRIAVDKQLAAGLRNVQVVLEELLDGKQRLLVQDPFLKTSRRNISQRVVGS